jgi:hypothetical protein
MRWFCVCGGDTKNGYGSTSSTDLQIILLTSPGYAIGRDVYGKVKSKHQSFS